MSPEEEKTLYDQITELLTDVEDPEIGIDIINLGLVYGIDISDNGIFLTITLTSAACPLQDYIEESIINTLSYGGVSQPVVFNWVFAPLWGIAMMTDEGRDMFRALGGHIPTY